jgi:hypothetical protein
MTMEISPGSLYRLEGWELEEGNFDLSAYRSKDLDWEDIVFEGEFLDPSENASANQEFKLPKYVKTTIDYYYENGLASKGSTYILFMIPQQCDEIEEGEGFPEDPNAFSADADGDYDDSMVLTFVCKDSEVMDLSRFKLLPMLGSTWESALENSPKFFIRK